MRKIIIEISAVVIAFTDFLCYYIFALRGVILLIFFENSVDKLIIAVLKRFLQKGNADGREVKECC